ncbi:hypothetical protein IX51_05180 [uncultured archaeon]|nr:hypothetical protein IX51_05180 [uncultured archaeon]
MSDYKFAVSAWIWYGNPATNGYDFIDKAGEIGYDGIEIPTFDGNIDEKQILDKLSSQKRKIEPVVVGGGSPDMDISSENEKIRENGLNYIKKLVDKASKINSFLVCGPIYSAVGKSLYLTAEQRERVIRRTALEIRKASEYATGQGVDLALEPLCRYDSYLINTTAEMHHFLDLAESENVGILLDTFHMNIEERSMPEAIRLAGDRFRHFQVCENDRGVPGKGSLDWKSIAAATEKSGYKGWVSLESFTPYEQEFSAIMRSWRPLSETQDLFASEGLNYLKKIFV